MRKTILYSLCLEDILSVAKDRGIDKKRITPEVIRSIQEGWSSGLQWYEVTEIALENALQWENSEKRPSLIVRRTEV